MKFGQYELRELIAVGGMAEVYRGRAAGAEGFEKYVAIKRILPDLAEDERFVKMLLTEARIHSALSHRNIVQIHDLGISAEGEYFIVLEFVEGYDLRMITDQLALAGEILPEALSLHVAGELAQALHFAHELRGADGQPLGLVHRDVTPSNILISMAGEVKLSDFGLAKRRHDRSVVGSLKGNLAYMSPEQARQSALDRRTDVFSLGAVLFEMLTGKRLREITDEIAGWNQVASGEVPSVRAARPDLPASFERLLAKALAPEPADRFADAAAFGVAIRAALVEMNTPVGASDLQALLATLSPPRRPRSLLSDRSKVIRLGPEARALGEAIAGPKTPPGTALPSGRATPGAAVRAEDVPPTPPPSTPLPPVQPWRATPRGPLPLPRSERPTPPGAFPAAGPGSAPARLHSDASAETVRRSSSSWPSAASLGLPSVASAGGGAALAVAQRPTERLRPVAAAPPRARRETMRVRVRGGSRIWPVAIVVGALLLGVAAIVHFAIAPLEVLAVWGRPATLTVVSEPPGAALRLDGIPLTTTPARLTVHRDRYEHVLQLAAPGYRPLRQVLRYDRSLSLAFTARLERAADAKPAPKFEALPAAEPSAPAAARAEKPAPVVAKRAAPAKAPRAAPGKTTKSGKAAKPTGRAAKAARAKR